MSAKYRLDSLVETVVLRGYIVTMSGKGKADRRNARLFPLEKEYARTITALDRTGILTLLPQSESLGVIGIDGKEYPVTTQEQLQEVFTRNKELVDRNV